MHCEQSQAPECGGANSLLTSPIMRMVDSSQLLKDLDAIHRFFVLLRISMTEQLSGVVQKLSYGVLGSAFPKVRH